MLVGSVQTSSKIPYRSLSTCTDVIFQGHWECPIEVIARGYTQSEDMAEEDVSATFLEELHPDRRIADIMIGPVFVDPQRNPLRKC